MDGKIFKDASNAVVAELTESDPGQLERSQMVKRERGVKKIFKRCMLINSKQSYYTSANSIITRDVMNFLSGNI